jgi:hypothetical protein
LKGLKGRYENYQNKEIDTSAVEGVPKYALGDDDLEQTEQEEEKRRVV